MAYGLSNGHMTDDVTCSRRCCEAVRSAVLATVGLLVLILTYLLTFMYESIDIIEADWNVTFANLKLWRKKETTTGKHRKPFNSTKIR